MTPERRPTGDRPARQTQVDARLIERGLIAGPRKVAAAGPPPPTENFARRLRRALEELGPVFSTFGRYLASRVDLLPIGDCVELARISEQAPRTPLEVVRTRLREDLGDAPEALFARFEARPFESRLLYQSHRARLADGRDLVVRLVRPGIEETIERDLPHLDRLAPALAAGPGPEVPFDEIASGFRAQLGADLDFAAQADHLHELTDYGAGSRQLVVAPVVGALSTGRVLVFEELSARGLDELAAEGAAGLARRGSAARAGRARRLLRLWLYLALVVRRFPTRFGSGDVIELADGRLALQGGTFATLPAASQASLWQYLRASSHADPLEALNWLLEELLPVDAAADLERLRLQIRQLVPFRDGSWDEERETLADDLFLHWRTARGCGYRASPHLLGFLTGLFHATHAGRRLEPGGDPLRKALEDLQWLAGWSQLREWSDLRRVTSVLEANVIHLMDLPTKLNQALNVAAGIDTRPGAGEDDDDTRSRIVDSSIVVGALMLLMSALALAGDRVASVLGWGGWVETVPPLLFLALGAWLLRAIVRNE